MLFSFALGLFLQGSESTAPSATGLSKGDLADKLIDRYTEEEWRKRKVKAADRSETHEFLRRVCLDLAGVIPSVDEAREFLKSRASNKREKLIDALLERPEFGRHWADVWDRALINADARQGEVGRYVPEFRAWLASQFNKNVAMDQIAYAMITAEGPVEEKPEAVYMIQNAVKNEGWLDAAADVSSHWMGIQISCAKCHDHPFAKWSQENFYQTAAFFVRTRAIRRQAGQNAPVFFTVADGKRGNIPLPDELMKSLQKRSVEPRFFDEFDPDGVGNPREQFAKILVSKENRQFARAVVNRFWAQLFGRGVIHPTNGFDDNNKPSHPELMEMLAIAFVENDYDVKWLLRSILNSKVYQLSSESGGKPPDETIFHAAAMRPLTPAQLVDSLTRMVGADDRSKWPRNAEGELEPPEIAAPYVRRALEDLFAVNINDIAGSKISIQQGLTLLNSELLHRALSCRIPTGLAARLMKMYDSPGERIEHIYLAALSRYPTPGELRRAGEHLSKVARGQPEGYEDIAWTLINSSEFIFIH